MSQLFDRVMCAVSGTPGTGTITLGSAVLDGLQGDRLTFAQASVPNGAIVSYCVVDAHNWGKGRGTYNSGANTLSRDAAEVTWNGSTVGATPISLTSNAVVFLTAIANDLPFVQEFVTSGSQTSVTFTVPAGVAYKKMTIDVDARSNLAGFNDDLKLQFNGDTGNNYFRQYIAASSAAAPAAGGDYPGVSAIDFGATPAASFGATASGSSSLIVPNYSNSSFQKHAIVSGGFFNQSGSGNVLTLTLYTTWANAAPITSAKVFLSSGSGFTNNSWLRMTLE